MTVEIPVTEAQVEATIYDLLNLYGWHWIHHRPARIINDGWRTPTKGTGAEGFPDIVAIRPPRLLLIELKGTRGRLSLTQKTWHRHLTQIDGIETYVWYPNDIDDALGILR